MLNGDIFHTLLEARIIIKRWRQAYNEVRPHSALGYRPPAPEARAFPVPVSLSPLALGVGVD